MTDPAAPADLPPPADGPLIDILVDDRPVRALPGESVRAAAGRHGIRIPGLCDIEGLEPLESCLVCVVQVRGERHLRPSCSAVPRPAMVVRTDTEGVLKARRVAMELLFSDHFGECLAPCELACPAGWDISGFLRVLAGGHVQEAAAAARAGIALPEVLGHVCTAPCERACRRAEDDQAIEIRALHRFASVAPLRRAPPTGKRVAVIGTGPSGLAAASRLLEYGHQCALLEAADAPGGTLRRLDEAELPPAVLRAEIDAILAAGAVLHAGEQVDAARLEALREDFDGIVLATGEGGLRKAAGGPSPAVVAVGAAAGRGGLAIRVVASGQAGAKALHHHLRGLPPPRRELTVRYGRLDEELRRTLFPGVKPRGPSARADFEDATAAAEAELCLQCGCSGCATCGLRAGGGELGSSGRRIPGERRPVERDDSHPAILFEAHKCILCGACIAVDEAIGTGPGIAIQGRGFHARVAGPAGIPLGEALDRRSALACAAVCPTRAMRRRLPGE